MASFGFSLAARFIQLVLGFLNVMLLSRYLGPQQYGDYTFVVNFVFLFTPLIDLSLNHIITREISQTGNISLSLIKASFFLRLILFLITLPIIILASKILLSDSDDLTYYILIYSFLLLNYCFSSANSYFVANYKLQFPSVVSIITNIFNTLILFSCIKLNYGLPFIFLSQAMFPVINVMILYFKIGRITSPGKISISQLTLCLKEIKYLTLAGIFTTIYFRINSALIFKFLGEELTGIFNSAYKFIDIVNPIISVLMMTIFPRMNDVISNKEKGLSINDLMLLMLFLGSVSIVFIFNFSDLIIKIVYGSRFIDAASILRILSVSLIFIFAGNVTGFLMIAHRIQKQYMLTSLFTALMNVILLVFIIPEYSVTGASIVAVITEMVTFIVSSSFLVKYSFLKPDFRYLKVLTLTIIFVFLSSVNVILYKSQLISVLVVLLFVALCIRFRIIPLKIFQKVFYEKRIGYNTNL